MYVYVTKHLRVIYNHQARGQGDYNSVIHVARVGMLYRIHFQKGKTTVVAIGFILFIKPTFTLLNLGPRH